MSNSNVFDNFTQTGSIVWRVLYRLSDRVLVVHRLDWRTRCVLEVMSESPACGTLTEKQNNKTQTPSGVLMKNARVWQRVSSGNPSSLHNNTLNTASWRQMRAASTIEHGRRSTATRVPVDATPAPRDACAAATHTKSHATRTWQGGLDGVN